MHTNTPTPTHVTKKKLACGTVDLSLCCTNVWWVAGRKGSLSKALLETSVGGLCSIPASVADLWLRACDSTASITTVIRRSSALLNGRKGQPQRRQRPALSCTAHTSRTYQQAAADVCPTHRFRKFSPLNQDAQFIQTGSRAPTTGKLGS